MKLSLRHIVEMLLLMALYIGAGKLGLSMARENPSASPVWPPTGLALAVLLLRGKHLWPGVFVGAFIVNVTIAHDAKVSEVTWIAASLAIAAGNTLEALVGEVLVRRFAGGARALLRLADVFRFFCIGAFPSTVISATTGAVVLCVAGAAPWAGIHRLWATWWTGDFVSDLLVAPLLIILFKWPAPRLSWKRWLEVVTLAVLTGVSSWMAFGRPALAEGGGKSVMMIAMSNLLLPLLLVAAFRFQQWGATLMAGLMSVVATIGTARALGPYADADPNTALMLLQAFVGIRMLTAMALAAVVSERMREREDKEAALEAERGARAEAERANRSKDEFLAVLSHELRTPLAPVLLTASLLENDVRLPEPLRADLRQIRENTTLEARLIDDLLDHSRIASGKMKLELRIVDVQEVVRKAVLICGSGRFSDLTMALEAGMPRVYGDAARLQQVFWNLINNALKFTPAGKPILIRAFNPDPSSVRVEVKDAGIGIDPKMVPRVFEAFEQGDARSAGRGGLGLGLTITRALVEAHGGRVTAHSEGQDKGTTFVVDLAVCARASAVPETVNGKAHRSEAKVRRVLLVEDHADTRHAMVRLLTALGHQVTAADTMKSAEACALVGSFDLVISDIGLPDASGLELMRRLRPLFASRGEAIWAIAVSGYGMESDLQASREAGFDAHLTKPVSPDRLMEAMEAAEVSQEIGK